MLRTLTRLSWTDFMTARTPSTFAASWESTIKIRENASSKGLGPRPEEVRHYQKVGYREWAKQKGYGMRWPASEGIFSAVKRIFGEVVKSHKTKNKGSEIEVLVISEIERSRVLGKVAVSKRYLLLNNRATQHIGLILEAR